MMLLKDSQAWSRFLKASPPLILCLSSTLAIAIATGSHSGVSALTHPGCAPIRVTHADSVDPTTPLWPGARFTEQDRRRAVVRGLRFIYKTAQDPHNFAEHGHDYLWCYDTTARAMKDEAVRSMAAEIGQKIARRWRQANPRVPPGASADTITVLVFGSDSADGLGVRDDAIKEEIRRAAARFSPKDFLEFDPDTEPPPSDVPEDCARCGTENPRGSGFCSKCKARLTMRSRYDVWSEALIITWSGDRYGVKLGASYADVLKWLPVMRPYRGREGGANREFVDIVYAVTHLVYTLNDYSMYRLAPAWLPQEFEFLKSSLKESIAAGNPDMLGEFMDTLRSFGLTEDDPLIQTGMNYLLSHQHADGSWGNMRRLRYHPTWTAIDGLSQYCWRGQGLSMPDLKPLLPR